jgi:hypothetical protein
MTLADLVEEYLGMHQAEPVTIAKLRWLLGKATSVLGPVGLADLSPKDIYAWRQTVPEGHRFEATQALRQVLSRAVEWEWLSDNPAKRRPGHAGPSTPAAPAGPAAGRCAAPRPPRVARPRRPGWAGTAAPRQWPQPPARRSPGLRA